MTAIPYPPPATPTSAATITAALVCDAGACPCQRTANRGSGLTHCPTHNDKSPSLSVSLREGRTLWNCKAGCPQDAVRAALVERGLWHAGPQLSVVPATVRPRRRRQLSAPTITEYPYRDADSALVAMHERHERVGEKKQFVWRLPNGQVSHGDIREADLPIYRLPELLAAPLEEPVILTEGERAADAARAHGFTACSLPGGASQRDFGQALEALRGRCLVLWPDNDAPGLTFMAHVGAALAGIAVEVRQLAIPGQLPKGDAWDYFASGHSAEELTSAIAGAGPPVAPSAPRPIAGPALNLSALTVELDALPDDEGRHARIRMLAPRMAALAEVERQTWRDTFHRRYHFGKGDFAALVRDAEQREPAGRGPLRPLTNDAEYERIDGESSFWLDKDRTAIYRKEAGGKYTPHIEWTPKVGAWGQITGEEPGRARWYDVTVGSQKERAFHAELVSGAVWERFPEAGGSAGRRNIGLLYNTVMQVVRGTTPSLGFAHLGWEEVNGEPVYITAGACIGTAGGRTDIEVAVSGALTGYALPTPPEGDALREAVRASLSLLELAPLTVTAPLLGVIALAPLREPLGAERPDFVLWLHGASGAHKSELAALAAAHYGPFTRQTLPARFDDTPNSLELLLNGAKDALLVVDDYRAGHSPAETHAMDATAAKLLRSAGNGSGKNRMSRDGSLRPERPPRTLALATGERLPEGHSTLARLFSVPVPPDAVDIARLTAAQGARELFPQAMAGYIQYLATHMGDLRGELPARFRDMREMLHGTSSHAREPGQVAHLLVGLGVFLEYAATIGALDAASQRELLSNATAALLELAEAHAATLLAERPVEQFLALIEGALVSRKAYLTDDSGGPPVEATSYGWERMSRGDYELEYRHSGERIGVLRKDLILLFPEPTYRLVRRLAQEQGRIFPVEQRTLWKRLDEDGAIIPQIEAGGRRYEVKVRIGDTRPRVVRLLRTLVSGNDDGGQPAEPNMPPTDGGPDEASPAEWMDVPAAPESDPEPTPPLASALSAELEDPPAEEEPEATEHAAPVGPVPETRRARCMYPAHAPSDWRSDRGVWVCGVCHPNPAETAPLDSLPNAGDEVPLAPIAAPSATGETLPSSLEVKKQRPPREDRRPIAVLDAGGIWQMDGATPVLRTIDIAADIAGVGQLFDLARAAGVGQLWVHASWLRAHELPATAPRNERGDLVEAGEHPFFANASAWDIQPAGVLSWWLHGFQRGVYGAVDIAIPAYNAAAGAWLSWDTATDGPTLLRALAYFETATGTRARRSPGSTGTGLMRALHSSPHGLSIEPPAALPPPVMRNVEVEPVCTRPLSAEERSRRYVHSYDKNAQFLGACSSLALGFGEAEHTAAGPVPFDRTRPGYWRARLLFPTLPAFPEAWLGLGEEHWYTTPTITLALELGASVAIAESYTWPEHHRALEPWYKRLRDARAALTSDGERFPDSDARELACAAVKAVYTQSIGWLSSRLWAREGHALYRPDWRDAIIAQARANLLRTAESCTAAGVPPFMVGADCLYFTSNEPDPVRALPPALTLGQTLRDFKVKDAAVPLADLLPLLDSPSVRVGDIQRELNRRGGRDRGALA